MSQNTYWIVVGMSPSIQPHRHDKHTAAVEEAKRLARINRGQVFTVFQATECYEAPPDLIETVFDDIPF